MTEYWVSQGNKWCDFCKIYIANNPASIRTHEFGQRHKDSVAKRLTDIRKENASKEKEKQQALKDMERIEAQAKRSYQKDLAAQERIAVSTAATTATSSLRSGNSDASSNGGWVYDEPSGYFYNATAGCYHDSKSGLYYSEKLGKWTSQQEALKGSAVGAYMPDKKGGLASQDRPLVTNAKADSSVKPPGFVLKDPKLIVPAKGRASSLEVGKRKRPEKPASLSKDEVDALKAREAAKKRVQEREKGLMGLYQSY